MNKQFKIILFFIIILLGYTTNSLCQSDVVNKYNVVWEEPSKLAADAMPLGNGSTGALVSVLENGTIWISVVHVDAWSEAHRLLKLGKVEITVSPNPFENNFKQELILDQGAIILDGQDGFKVKIWIDANHPIIHFESSCDEKFKIDTKLYTWRKEAKNIRETNFNGVTGGIAESADVILKNDKNAIIWFHKNSHTKVFDVAIKALEIPTPTEKIPNVLENRIFGAWISGDEMTGVDSSTLTSSFKKKHHIKIYTSVKQVESSDQWVNDLESFIENKESSNFKKDWKLHVAWWKSFWDLSYIHVSGSEETVKVSAGYAYVMYLNAMAGRGEFPIMWNGSMFSPPTNEIAVINHTGTKTNNDPDFRPWGNIMLHQNVRLPFYSMYASGQFDMVKPFFNLYMRGLPLMKEHTLAVFGHEGTVIRESTTLWGVIAPGVYGINREGLEPGQQESVWHRTHWQGGLEVANFMADYYQYTLNPAFATDTLIPFANEIVKFFDLHWPYKNGKLHFPHVFAMETFRDTDNPMPLVAGLRAVLNQLLILPEELTTKDNRAYWKNLLGKVPAIPLRERNGKTILANADTVYSPKVNVEVSELYAVFPYHLYGVGLPDLNIAQETFRNRTILVDDVGGKNPSWSKGFLRGGWRQEVVMAAMVGLVDSVKNEVVWSLFRPVPGMRFPGFFQTTYDGVPDVQHASMAATGLQKMLQQNVGDKIILMPTWPEDWNCSFKLYAFKNTIVEGKIINGELSDLTVFPENRAKDVFIGQELKKPEASVWK